MAGEETAGTPPYGFTAERAADCFYRLADLYYARNFGRMKKEDVDLLMFGFFDELWNQELSDYKMGLCLGLDTAAVRRKRSKYCLTYGEQQNDAWVTDVINVIKSGQYSYDDKKVTVPFKSTTVCDAFQNYMETNRIYFDFRYGINRVSIDKINFVKVVATKIKDDYPEQYSVSDQYQITAKVVANTVVNALLPAGVSEVVGAGWEYIEEIAPSLMDNTFNSAQILSEKMGEGGRKLLGAVFEFFRKRPPQEVT